MAETWLKSQNGLLFSSSTVRDATPLRPWSITNQLFSVSDNARHLLCFLWFESLTMNWITWWEGYWDTLVPSMTSNMAVRLLSQEWWFLRYLGNIFATCLIQTAENLSFYSPKIISVLRVFVNRLFKCFSQSVTSFRCLWNEPNFSREVQDVRVNCSPARL